MEAFETSVAGNTIARWLLALAIAAVVMASVSLWRWVIMRRLRHILHTGTFFDEVGVVVVENTSAVIVILLAFYLGSLVLDFNFGLQAFVRSVAIILLLVQFGLWGRALIARWVARYDEKNRDTNAAGVGTARVLSILARFGLYVLVFLLILDNIPGVEITTLIAGLGIGGIAVALAVQNILSDILASLSITLDKPFVLGDFIIVGDDVGTVQQIGIKTTRVRSLSGEQLIFSNNDLLNSRVRNLNRMEERRIVFSFRVGYETPAERLRELPALVQGFIEAQADTRFDRASLLRFDDIGYFYEVVYFVLTPEFQRYIAIQHAVNMALVEHFVDNGVTFASLAEGSMAEKRARSSDGAVA